jgi:hypothetical protein
MVFKRFPSGKYMILPKYSPTRLGMVTENATPESVALNADKNEIGYIVFMVCFHFHASSPQLINISTKAKNRLLTL